MKKPSLLIVGAGYVGCQAALYFRKRGWTVFGLTRGSGHRLMLFSQGITPILQDITSPYFLRPMPSVSHVIICVAPNERTPAAYEQTYVVGVANVLRNLRRSARLQKVVYLSSTGVWEKRAGLWRSETDVPDATSPTGKILIAAENQLLRAKLPAMIFRLAGIYGPGRSRLEAITKGSWPQPGPDHYMNMIHRDDIVGGIDFLFSRGLPGQTYLGVDEVPVLQSTFCDWLKKHNLPVADHKINPQIITKNRYTSQKLKSLGFRFHYPSFREGYAAMLPSSQS